MSSVDQIRRSDAEYLCAFSEKRFRFRRASIAEVPVARLLDILRRPPESLSDAVNWEEVVEELRASVQAFIDADSIIAVVVRRVELLSEDVHETGTERTYVLVSREQYEWLKRTNSDYYFGLLARGDVNRLMTEYYSRSLEYCA